jgi:DNA-binding LytR/AlgR family response regulator
MVSVSSAECIWVESAGNSVRIHTASRTLLLRETLHAVERLLGAESFARVSRRALVNIRCIERVAPSHAGRHRVRLVDGTEVTMSPTFAPRVIAAIESRRRHAETPGSGQFVLAGTLTAR